MKKFFFLTTISVELRVESAALQNKQYTGKGEVEVEGRAKVEQKRALSGKRYKSIGTMK